MSQRNPDQDKEDLGVLQELITAVRAEEPTEAEWQTARQNLRKKLQSTRKENWIMTIFRKTGSTRMRWAAASALAAAALALVIVFNPWRPPRDVFAAAVERFHNARTLTLTSTDDFNPGPIDVAYKEPGRFRITMKMGFMSVVIVADHQARKAITLYPENKWYDEMTFTPNPATDKLIDDLRSLPLRADEELGKRELDGRTVLGFRVKRDAVGELKNIAVWVDAKTCDPVRLEGEHELMDPTATSGTKTRTVHRVMSNFKFNVDLDDSLFDTNPPAGYTVGPMTLSRRERPPVEKGK